MKAKSYLPLVLAVFVLLNLKAFSQNTNKDKGTFVEPRNEFWEEIKKSVDDFNKKPVKPNKQFKMDFAGTDIPKSKDEFKFQWHNDPLSQGSTGTCWCFSTTSFMETEANRLTKRKFKFSEIHTVYWEYVEKAIGFVNSKGTTAFEEGGEANALIRIWKKYGCLPADSYSGKKPGQIHHDHSKMLAEMKAFLNHVKQESIWNEEFVVSTIKSILNSYLGTPPSEITIDGIKYSPVEYLNKIVKLNMDDYVDFMSLMQYPYFKTSEYEVPDNWWHNSDYHNLPLDDYMNAIKEVVKKGYTIEIGGDVSEPGYASSVQAGIVPSFDIPHDYIDENARQLRFSNKTSTDDHGIHVVGYKEKDGVFWFLIKDSGSGSFNGGISKGYYFYHEDYVKLKILSFIVHKSAVQDYLKKFE